MSKINYEKQKDDFLFKILCITIFFNIWFPKAGIKISGIPLTIGNVFFAITFILWFLKKIRSNNIPLNKMGISILIYILIILIKYIFIGDFINNISFIVPLIIYPLGYFLSYDLVKNDYEKRKVTKIIVYGFFFITMFAILQFIVGIENCTIPGLTVNYTDYKELGKFWYMSKSNGVVVSSSKIVSTFQNGNIFGINVLLIFPFVYYYFKDKKEKINLITSLLLFISTIFLSLSRACWLGIIIFIFLCIFRDKSIVKNDFMNKFLLIILCVISILLVFKYIPSVYNRFFNTKASNWISMSGRTEGLMSNINAIINSGSIIVLLIGAHGILNYSGLAYEMFPLALFVQVGLIGCFLLYRIFFKIVFSRNNSDYINKGIRYALIIWLIVGIIEGAYWLPPTALNLFLLLGMYNFNLKKEDDLI